MRDKTILPTNLFDWPRVAPRLPEEKLILVGCWIGGGWMRSCGCGMLPLRPFAASLGFSPDALQTGLRNLSSTGVELLAIDETTGELFVMDWFRFHTFKSPVSVSIAQRDIQKTVSEPLKKLILEKSRTCLPTATSTRTSSSAGVEILAPANRTNTFSLGPAGVHLWTPSDQLAADQLVDEHGLDAVAAVISQMDTEPLPGRVRRKLEQLARAQRAAAKRAASATAPLLKAHLEIDPAAQAAGEALLAKIRQKQTNDQGATQ